MVKLGIKLAGIKLENVGISLDFRRIKQAKSGIKLTKWGMMADDYDTAVKLVQAAHFRESRHPFQSIPHLHVFFDPFLKGFLLHLSSLSAEAANTSHFLTSISAKHCPKYQVVDHQRSYPTWVWLVGDSELRTENS